MSIGGELGTKVGVEGEDEYTDEDLVDFKSLTTVSFGSHESSVGKAAGGRFGLNSMIFGCKDGLIRVDLAAGRGDGEGERGGEG